MNSFTSARERWQAFLQGQDAGPMVSPLCDDWSLDIPYHWPCDEPELFPAGHRYHALCQQMAIAKICGWDPLYLAAVDFTPLDESLRPVRDVQREGGGTRTQVRIDTPYGPLTYATLAGELTTGVAKEWLVTREDYQRTLYLVRSLMRYDEGAAIEQGRLLRRQIGGTGLLGTWVETPLVYNNNMAEMYYHLCDWPDLFRELHEASVALQLRRLQTLGKAGFDYIFFVCMAAEWLSPDFFRAWVAAPAKRYINAWRGEGGRVLWHSCGKVARFVELGFYNEMRPDIFETLSEPPTGDLPSLRWARQRLHPSIATKGNVGLDTLLQGTPDEVRAAVRRVREQTEGYRHIVGLSDDMLRNTPLPNALAFVDEARR